MKKIHMMLIGLLGLMLSGTASAVSLTTGGSTDITLLTCTQLANDITVVLSSGVAGEVDCETDTVFMGVSVCHTTGLTSNRSYNETSTSTACTAMGGTFTASTNKCSGTTTGARFPTATTAQGTVSSVYPGVDCSTAEAKNVINDAIGALP